MASVINSFGISGINAYLVKIETDTIYGQPSVSIVGLGDTAVKESKERLEAAVVHTKYEFPKMKIVINLSPCDIKKCGSHFDLGMAIGLLIQSKQIVIEVELDNFAFIGELSLNADLRPCSGILPMVIEAKKLGIKNVIVPKENMEEASLVTGINIFGFRTLNEIIDFLEGTSSYGSIDNLKEEHIVNTKYLVDFSDVQGQNDTIELVMIAAAGGHNILLSGAPGCGKSMIAKRIPTILPAMTEEEALEVTKIYSVSGMLKNRGKLITERPFRAPHHNASTNSLIGGGNNAMPGEISLAHNGVLFLDEIAEFNKRTLDALRQPMEDNIVTVSRVKSTNTYPAKFMLVAAMNPCPCGYYGEKKCKCTDYEVLKYRQKISGPILDRIDIQKNVQGVKFMNLTSSKNGVSSEYIRKKVETARKIQIKRYEKFHGINCNSQMTPDMIKKFCALDQESLQLLQKAYEKYRYSVRTFHKFLKVARTFADIDQSEKILKKHIAKSIMCRELEKEQCNMIVV
ncbi:YifB family Mg chelatase-like AAA ATPase [Clostridium oryzae]|uniref:Competence protein ComM n=1 Tax=Clostridium oryzae TaxID=1450648 RepID=A0A1V4J091_9CLOT|nr:YifB family Mg chelatase-like AAA ATPase [Clostridium oryzae]OPJ65077.1 competence protein ComM [Clostridium oryzae]